MSIATAITAAQLRVADAYTHLESKGATMPTTKDLANMPDAIDSITSGEEGWTRNSDAPDLDSIDVLTSHIYITYQPDLDPIFKSTYFIFDIATTIEEGTIVDGNFVTDNTYSLNASTIFNHAISTDRKYTVYHIYPQVDGNFITKFSLSANLNQSGFSNTFARNNYYYQPIYEMYYNINYAQSNLKSNYYVQHIKKMGSHSNSAQGEFCGDDNLRKVEMDCDFSNCTSMDYFFYSCQNLKEIVCSTTDFGKVTDLSNSFYACKRLCELDLSAFDFSSVIKLQNFSARSSIYTIIMPECSPTNLQSAFCGMDYYSPLKILDLSRLDLTNATNLVQMVVSIDNIEEFIQPKNWCNAVVNMNNFLWGTNLRKFDLTGFVAQRGSTNVDFSTNIYQLVYLGSPVFYCDFKICTSNDWLRENLMLLVNALPQLDDGETFTFTMGSTSLAKLTDDDKAIATDKGWTLA